VPASHPLQKALEDWAPRSKRNPAARLNPRCIRAAAGKAFDHYDMRRDGIADVT